MSSVETLEKRVAELEDSIKRHLYLTIIGIISAIVFAVLLWLVPSRNDFAIIQRIIGLEMKVQALSPPAPAVEATPAATEATPAP